MTADIEQGSAALADALARGDAGAAARLYDVAGRLVTAVGIVNGRQHIEAYWRAGLSLGLATAELTPTEIHVDGPFAVESGRYALTVQFDDGRSVVHRGSYLVIHSRDDHGSWRRAVERFESDSCACTQSVAEETT